MAHHIRLHARLLVAACVCSAAAGMAVPGAALLAQAAQNPGTPLLVDLTVERRRLAAVDDDGSANQVD